MNFEEHYVTRSGWIRAAILGANDGILSTASIAIGVAVASETRDPIVLAAVAGLVAGALAMAAGEYVSVSSQADIEAADLAREEQELLIHPEHELEELAEIYVKRGIEKDLAMQVAIQLTAHNALEAHARDELGINEITQAKPLQAALASGSSFVLGGLLPLLVTFFAPLQYMEILQYTFSICFLLLLGIAAAVAGGSSIGNAILRITFWGTMAMGITAWVGSFFGVSV